MTTTPVDEEELGWLLLGGGESREICCEEAFGGLELIHFIWEEEEYEWNEKGKESAVRFIWQRKVLVSV